MPKPNSPLDHLKTDPTREDYIRAETKSWLATGVFIRAKRADKWESVDIYELDTESLKLLLAVKGSAWVDNLVLILLGH